MSGSSGNTSLQWCHCSSFQHGGQQAGKAGFKFCITQAVHVGGAHNLRPHNSCLPQYHEVMRGGGFRPSRL
ncbi:hypothetical protein ATR1_067c0117, partial [Acetobacter tropicalis]